MTRWKLSKHKTANSIGGIVSLAMMTIEEVLSSSEPFEIFEVWGCGCYRHSFKQVVLILGIL